MLGTKSGLTVAAIAQELGVSERTIRNDIRQLNEDLGDGASIEGVQGRYSLRIFDPDAYKKAYEKICETDGMFDTPRGRQNYIFAELMRADAPLLTDELAYEMNVGRTTLVSDRKKLREELTPFGLKIVGKTSKGMILHGKELDIRTYVLENCFDAIYSDYPLDEEIRQMIHWELHQKAFEKQVGIQFERYLILMMDRFLTGHFIGKLSDAYYNLTANAEFFRVNGIIDRIAGLLHVDFPVEEKIFTFLPIAGMRTPADLGSVQEMELDETIGPLSEKIMAQIREELGVSIDPRDFAKDFAYHLMFMLNRCTGRGGISVYDCALALGVGGVMELQDGGPEVEEAMSMGIPSSLMLSGNALVASVGDAYASVAEGFGLKVERKAAAQKKPLLRFGFGMGRRKDGPDDIAR